MVYRLERKCLLFSLSLAGVAILVFCDTASVSEQEPDPQCTTNRKGLTSCNFDQRNCYNEVRKDDMLKAWTLANENQHDLPISPMGGRYIFLSNAPRGDPRRVVRRFEASISNETRAICVDFYYASTGNASLLPLSFILKETTGNETSENVMYKIDVNTDGQWNNSDFYCCLPRVQKERKFVVKGTSEKNSMLALDHLDVRISNMTCENDRLVCYPRPANQVPLEPADDSPTCSDEEEPGASSCDFHTDDKDTPNFCSWTTASEDWLVKQKYDGSGQYDIIQTSRDEGAYLTSPLDADVHSLCVEVEFALENPKKSLRNVFSFHIVNPVSNQSFLWAKSYSYKGDKSTEWKRLNLQECVTNDMPQKMIVMNITKKDVRINYIHMRKLHSPDCLPPPTQQSIEEIPGMVFSCPSSAALPLCGFTGLPESTWEEVTFQNIRHEPVFEGAAHYLYFTSETLQEAAASLSTGILKAENETILHFSYNFLGPADINIRAINIETNITEELWVSNKETRQQWVSQEARIKTLGEFKIVFEVFGLGVDSDIGSNEPFTLGFTNITVMFAPEESATGAPPKETGGQNATEVSPQKTGEEGATEASPQEIDEEGATEASPQETDEEGSTEASPNETGEEGTTNEKEGKDSGSNTGVIVGSIFGVLIVVALVAAGVWVFYFKRRDDQSPKGRYVENGNDLSLSPEPQRIENIMYNSTDNECNINY